MAHCTRAQVPLTFVKFGSVVLNLVHMGTAVLYFLKPTFKYFKVL